MSVESVLQRVATLEQALANPTALLAAAARSGGTAAPAETAPEAATPSGGSSFAEALQSASAGYQAPSPSASALATATGSSGVEPATAALAYPTLPSTYTGVAGGSTQPPYSASGLSGLSVAGSPTPTLGSTAGTGNTGARIVAIAESQIGQSEQPPGSNESPAIAQYRSATAGAMPGAPWCAYFASWAARQAGAPLGAQGEGLGSVSEIWSWAQSSGRAIPNGPGVVPQPGDLIVFGGEHVGIVKDVLPNGDIQTVEGNYENKVAQNTRTPTEATGYVNMN
ncbi:MAG TPA: CHAP domain-containing protein [Solirubrobacteraceae bacterium]|jgi:hypothetical protein